ncbi:asparagine synthase (glutamine-hydrolyzing) [Azonexus sp.]|jgi:asparagine synthase (glutamine-hydrolysing)|uniref:asparagine synthase (glutamine-hydrolyzing) n=1 Tax=Azonexus sp. TaxID=1872668 RepID=UPI0028284C3D|nr:asparagine synthase (glutamine-hydrolyzing) [Azonexus sp.]MDR1995922.1 asparagine synthase (glutamine-hydrolyzing) [Azonexus sp.]
MCGFVGLAGNVLRGGQHHEVIKGMLNKIGHRGPDGEGLLFSRNMSVGLGHRRLAIIDPERGKQPMTTEDGNLTIVFNGAIYNYLELRRELIGKGHPIRSYSDTEVLLYAYREWGENCVDRFLGMFAFAIWDERNQRLFCARDRIGIKPFYYAFDGRTLVFGSEIKAILASGVVKAEANRPGLQDYLTFQFCLGDKTLFKDIKKLEPGHCMLAQLNGSQISIHTRQYWDLEYEIDERHDERWFVDHLAALIEDATRMHLRSDVPLGAHLSGGLDSSAVVCLAAGLLKGERIKTFTGAFPEGPQFNETGYAKEVSAFAGTDYKEIYIQGSELPDVLPRLMYYMDEPLAGPGVIPQYYVSKLASEYVKVVLGGQGGDELFIGYTRYLVAYLEKCLAGAIYQTADQHRYAVSLESIVPNLPLLQTYHPMLQGFWSKGLFDAPDKRYFSLIDRSEGMNHLFSGDLFSTGYSPFESFQQIFNRDGLHSLINRMTYFDLKGSLPALLHVEDRTSMAASIESRVPLLDHRIVEFMATIPPNIKFAGGRMKHLFKEAVRSTVPQKIFDRQDKMGFPTPLAQWTKGVAREYVRDILLSDRVRERGIYNIDAIGRAIDSEREFGRVVWGLLCLELWHRIFIDGDMKVNA